ncbi:hypothetical protein ACFCV3_22035 [Kribbella sp. NPDC056345]|uniref:hypothetical protein n=1 Tax=Kribbella sp. NPDC056345 TaxID=3345789 RepID=UPI0035D9FB2C
MSATESTAESILRSAIDVVESGGAVDDPVFATAVLNAAADVSRRLPVTQHPLGFLHLDLSNLVDRRTARLHLWTEDFLAMADPLGRLHDHTWELRSAVLVGELTDHVLVPVQDAAGDYLAHVVHYEDLRNRIESSPERWSLDELQERTVRQGQSYNLAPRLVHRTEVFVLPTATLVVPVERGGPGPTVFAPRQLRCIEAASRVPIDARVAEVALRSAAKSVTV